MTWATANAWAACLDVYGISGWRLPTVIPLYGTTTNTTNESFIGTENSGHNVSAPGTAYAGSTASEMAHLFYNTLGNKSYCDPATSTVSVCSGPQADYGLTNTGPFSNVRSDTYWSASEYESSTISAWRFVTSNGYQYYCTTKSTEHYAWVVHAGDVGVTIPSAVPVPAAAWLFSSGLLGLVGVARRKVA